MAELLRVEREGHSLTRAELELARGAERRLSSIVELVGHTEDEPVEKRISDMREILHHRGNSLMRYEEQVRALRDAAETAATTLTKGIEEAAQPDLKVENR